LQSLPDITVGDGDAEVDREHLEAGERAEQRGKVCRVEVGGGGRKVLQSDPDEIRAGTAEEA